MTKADLYRKVIELDVQNYIEAVDFEINDTIKEYSPMEGMNWFIQDMLFPMEKRRTLIIKFKEKQPGHYLNGSMVRFVVSQLQMEIAEFCCVGVVI